MSPVDRHGPGLSPRAVGISGPSKISVNSLGLSAPAWPRSGDNRNGSPIGDELVESSLADSPEWAAGPRGDVDRGQGTAPNVSVHRVHFAEAEYLRDVGRSHERAAAGPLSGGERWLKHVDQILVASKHWLHTPVM